MYRHTTGEGLEVRSKQTPRPITYLHHTPVLQCHSTEEGEEEHRDDNNPRFFTPTIVSSYKGMYCRYNDHPSVGNGVRPSTWEDKLRPLGANTPPEIKPT